MRAQQGLSYDVLVDGMLIHVTHKRVRNINMRLGSDGTPRMSVPLNISQTQATQFARDHASWFAQALAKKSMRQQTGPQLWESGEQVQLWGEPHELVVDYIEGQMICRISEGKILMSVPEVSTAAQRDSLFNELCKLQIRWRLTQLQPACEERVGRHATSITLRRMKSRWGSCTPSTGRIRLNTALAECPESCLETVLVHELCHLRVPNHSAQFYACMDLYCPDWRVHQRWLDQHNPRVQPS